MTPAARTAYLYSRGALRRFPEGLVLGRAHRPRRPGASGVISPEGVARAAEDLTMGPDAPGTADESVGALVRRRLGDEIYDMLVGPLLSGVNAGDADHLSVAAGAPQFAAALRQHGSLIAGARAQRQASAATDAPVFYGLPTGTQTLTDTLAGPHRHRRRAHPHRHLRRRHRPRVRLTLRPRRALRGDDLDRPGVPDGPGDRDPDGRPVIVTTPVVRDRRR